MRSGHIFYLLPFVVALAFFGPSAVASDAVEERLGPSVDAPVLALDARVRWQEVDDVGPRCFTVQVPSPGLWWIEVKVTAAATTPELVVFSTASEGKMPAVLERIHGVLLRVPEPGGHTVCLTSQLPLGTVELGNVFSVDKAGDPKETEPEPEG